MKLRWLDGAGAALCALALCACSKPAPPGARGRIVEASFGHPQGRMQLQGGFVSCNPSWCMTGRVFRFAMEPPPRGEEATYLELDLVAPADLFEAQEAVTLTGRANGFELERRTYRAPGRYVYAAHIPEPALRARRVTFEFELDKSFRHWETGTVQGLIVISASLKPYEATLEHQTAQAARAREEYAKAAKALWEKPAAALRDLDQAFRSIPAWDDLRFQGIEVRHNPFDLWMTQQIIFEVRPECVIELGTGRGGEALYYARVLSAAGFENSSVVTVDAEDRTQEAAKLPMWGRVVFVQGDPASPAAFEQVLQFARDRPAMVIVNYDGNAERFFAALRTYAPLVSEGSYLIAALTQVGGKQARNVPDPAARAAIERFLRDPAGKGFAADRSREMYLATWNPGGWLKRRAQSGDSRRKGESQ